MASSRLLPTRLAAAEQHEAALPAAEAVHEMRVALRRLRAALRVLGLRELDPDVKRLQDALGEVRDLQLHVDWFRGRDAGLCRAQQGPLRKAEQALARELRTWRSSTLPALLEAAGTPAAPSHKVQKILRKRLARLEERLLRARRSMSPAALHRARISVKQVRYLLEVAKGAVPKKTSLLKADLKSLQATLGELHDVDVRIGLLKRRPTLLRDQQEARKRLGKIAAEQLARWDEQRLVEHATSALR